MQKTKKTRSLTAAMLAFAVIFVLLALCNAAITATNNASQQLKSQLEELAYGEAFYINGFLNGHADGSRNLSEYIGVSSFDGCGYTCVINSDGKFIAHSGHKNELFAESDDLSFLADAVFMSGSYEELCNGLKKGSSGFVEYKIGGSARYSCYTPLDFEDWYIITAVPSERVDFYADKTRLAMYLLAGEMIAVFILLAVIMHREQRRRSVQICIANDSLKLLEERFRIAVSHTPSLVFEYNYITETVTVLNSNLDMDNRSFSDFVNGMYPATTLVHPQDMENYKKFTAAVLAGDKNCVLTLRMKTDDNSEDYKWFRISLTNVRDGEGKPSFTVGTLEDVHTQKSQEELLVKKAKQDALTGLLNRNECEQLTEAALTAVPEGRIGAFYMMDVDSFKSLNDTSGHVFGDSVLIAVAKEIKRVFYDTEIVGRLGGDEFIVFQNNLESLSEAEKRATELNCALRQVNARLGCQTTVCLSIGIVKAERTDSFKLLYKKSDKALYRAKQNGKNQYHIYKEEEDGE